MSDPLSPIETLRSTNLYLAYQRGWTDGAANLISRPRVTDPASLKEAYRLGHADGARSRRSALTHAGRRYGYQTEAKR